jgi:hypothetical protein
MSLVSVVPRVPVVPNVQPNLLTHKSTRGRFKEGIERLEQLGRLEPNSSIVCSSASVFSGRRQGITGASAAGSVLGENALIDEIEDVT